VKVSDLIRELNHRYPGRVVLLEDQRTVLLTGPTASRTLTMEMGDDAVRISVGRIVHAEVFEGADDLPHVTAIIDALLDGRAEELFGSTGTGVVGFIGYRNGVLGAPVTRMDEGAEILHVAAL
jgi:hypothetical protein